MKTVILTDAQLTKTLACIRSLGSKGIKVIACEKTRFAIGAFSKYIHKFLVYPDPKKDKQEFINWLLNTLKKYPDSVLFPMDDTIMKITSDIRENLKNKCILPYPTLESYQSVLDKGLFSSVCNLIGVDIPNTYTIKDLNELDCLGNELKYPVIIKPRISSGSRGIKIAQSKEELLSVYIQIHNKFPFPIIQDYLGSGKKFDVCLLYGENTELKASFVYEEVRLFPIENGPSTVQKSVFYPELVEISKKVLEHLKWYGVADLEFMIDPKSNRPMLLEINPRFWNPVNVAVLSGVDFPYLLYKLAIEEPCTECFDYKKDILSRNLLPGDLLHFIANKDRFRMNPSFFSGRRKGLHDDIISIADPLPFLGFILACLRYLFDINMWKFIIRR